MDLQKEKIKMLQSEMIDYIEKELGNEFWIHAYYSEKEFCPQACFYCVIAPNKEIKKSLTDFSWDFHIGDGIPCCEHSGKYIKYGNNRNIKPLVFYRTFGEARPSYIEIFEEFRLFHNLYFDKLNNKYIKINDDGEEEDIIVIKDLNVDIKTSAIKEFLAITNQKLLILFDIKSHSNYTLEELNISDSSNTFLKKDLIYNISTRNIKHFDDNSKSLSRLLGKKVIKGFLKRKCNIYPFNETRKKQYIKFITQIDKSNKPVLETCNPEIWDNFFKIVTFKKEVLNKYYSNPNKYTVGDGGIYCGNLWYLPIDNDNTDKIIVILGDLGKLSYEEQMYWRSFNIPPQGGMSKTCFNRSFMCEAMNAESADLKFKQNFEKFNNSWKAKYGWYLFLPLTDDDIYQNQILRIPLTDNQSEFDEQVLGLAKITIDSLNEKELNKYSQVEIKGSICKLDNYLKCKQDANHSKYIKFLRNLQTLRSCSAAHRKGSNYKKIKKQFNIGEKSLRNIFEEILDTFNEFLQFLSVKFELE